jgi:hypothetical protein
MFYSCSIFFFVFQKIYSMLLELRDVKSVEDHHVIKQLQSHIVPLKDVSQISMILVGSFIWEPWEFGSWGMGLPPNDVSSILLPMTNATTYNLSHLMGGRSLGKLDTQTTMLKKACPTMLDAMNKSFSKRHLTP